MRRSRAPSPLRSACARWTKRSRKPSVPDKGTNSNTCAGNAPTLSATRAGSRRARGATGACLRGPCRSPRAIARRDRRCIQRSTSNRASAVRIETKFARVEQGMELRVRIFPDDISIAAPPSAVTEDERVAGETYWRVRADSRAHPATPSVGATTRDRGRRSQRATGPIAQATSSVPQSRRTRRWRRTRWCSILLPRRPSRRSLAPTLSPIAS